MKEKAKQCECCGDHPVKDSGELCAECIEDGVVFCDDCAYYHFASLSKHKEAEVKVKLNFPHDNNFMVNDVKAKLAIVKIAATKGINLESICEMDRVLCEQDLGANTELILTREQVELLKKGALVNDRWVRISDSKDGDSYIYGFKIKIVKSPIEVIDLTSYPITNQ